MSTVFEDKMFVLFVSIYSTVSLELKTKDQDVFYINIYIFIYISKIWYKERDSGYTNDSIPNSNILYTKNSL